MSDESQTEQPAERTIYDQVVENLNNRIVPPKTRGRLRDALDKADTPTQAEKSNEAFKRIIG